MPLLPDLTARRRTPEIMDEPGLDDKAHRTALAGLARINLLGRSAALLWPSLADLARAAGPVRVLDVATGGGDVPLQLWRRARRANLPIALDGCDVSPTALDVATRRAADAGAPVRFFRADVLADDLPSGYDVVLCSLFLHHLDGPDAVTLLRRLRDAAGRMVIVSDLERGRLNYLLVAAGCRLLTRSPVVHIDGPRSIEGAFTADEARRLARDAGLHGAHVARRWPCRFLLTWRRP